MTDDLEKLRALALAAPEGPYFAAEDPADDARPHRGSGLALVDTGRASDWPIARLTEWNTARYLAAVHPQAVLALLDRVAEAERMLAESDAVIAGMDGGNGHDRIHEDAALARHAARQTGEKK